MPTPTLTLPDRNAPTNLRLKDSVQARYIDGDLLDIARQLRARHPSLYVLELTEAGAATWAVMESCEDGVERLVFKVKELDQRVLHKLDRIMSRSLAERVAQCERENHEYEQQAKEGELDMLYEKVGRPMWTQLEHDGFIQRGVSYAKRGISYKPLEKK